MENIKCGIISKYYITIPTIAEDSLLKLVVSTDTVWLNNFGVGTQLGKEHQEIAVCSIYPLFYLLLMRLTISLRKCEL